MACGAQFAKAVALAAQAPKLSVGCHVVLVDGSPVLDSPRVSSLIANSGPHFRESIISFALLATTGRLDQDQIEAEVTAQIKKLQTSGVRVSHLDSHKHTHMFPVALKGILRAARACGVRAIRNPFEPIVFATSGNWKLRFQLGILNKYQATFRDELAAARMVTPKGCIGIIATGGLNMTTFQDLIRNLPEGTWEFVSHPGYNDSDLQEVKTRLRDSREMELAILTSEAVKVLLRKEGVELISYDDLAPA
jgi:predicted glycoside hydrolase/deacetylase ChbG (UPF0249 family)